MNRNLTLTLTGIFLFALTHTMTMVMAPLAALELGGAGAVIGILVAAPNLLSLLADMPAAILSDGLGRRPAMLAGTVTAATGAAVFALGEDLFWLLVAMLAGGLANSLFFGPALAYISETCREEEHARVQGYNGAVQGTSAFLGAMLAGLLVDRASFVTAFAVVAGLNLLAVVAVWGIVEVTEQAAERLSVGRLLAGLPLGWRFLWTRPHIQMAGLVALVYNIVLIAAGNTFFPVYVTTSLGYSVALAGTLLSVRNLLATAVSPFFATLVARFGFLRVLLLSPALSAVALILVPWGAHPFLLLILLGIQGAGVGFIPAIANVLVTAGTSPRDRALGFAAVNLVSRSGLLLVPPLLGRLADFQGTPATFVTGGSLSVLCLATLGCLAVAHARALEFVPIARRRR